MNIFVILVAYGKTSSDKISKVLDQLNINYIITDPDFLPSYNDLNKLTHIILSGGPKHVYDNEIFYNKLPQWVIDINVPVLSICYGFQLVAYHFGGTVIKMDTKEEGLVEVTEIINNQLIDNMRWMNRHDQVLILPPQFTITGITYHNHIAAFTDYNKWFCYQYHPEADIPDYGIDINIFTRFFNI